jgi:hypothetical protein
MRRAGACDPRPDRLAGDEALQVSGHLRGARIAVPRIAGHGLQRHALEIPRHIGDERGRMAEATRHHLLDERAPVGRGEGLLEGEQLVEDEAQSVDIVRRARLPPEAPGAM